MILTTALRIAPSFLPDAKLWLRKTADGLNDEIVQTVAACLLDLANSGISQISEEDPLIQQAVKLYLKAQFGYDDKSEKWAAAYEHLKAALSLSHSYT